MKYHYGFARLCEWQLFATMGGDRRLVLIGISRAFPTETGFTMEGWHPEFKTVAEGMAWLSEQPPYHDPVAVSSAWRLCQQLDPHLPGENGEPQTW